MKIPRFSSKKMLAAIESQGKTKSDFIRDCVCVAARKKYRVKPSPQYLYSVFNASIQPSDVYLKLFGEVLGVQVRDLFAEVELKVQMREQA